MGYQFVFDQKKKHYQFVVRSLLTNMARVAGSSKPHNLNSEKKTSHIVLSHKSMIH